MRANQPPLDDRDTTVALEARASTVLADVDTTVIVRTLDRQSLPALYVADPEVLRKIDRTRAQGLIPFPDHSRRGAMLEWRHSRMKPLLQRR